jgi:hypothetical protein
MVVWYVLDLFPPFFVAKVHPGMWKDRVLQSDFKDNALKMGFATEEDLKRMSDAWRDFPSIQDACYMVVHGEMVLSK